MQLQVTTTVAMLLVSAHRWLTRHLPVAAVKPDTHVYWPSQAQRAGLTSLTSPSSDLVFPPLPSALPAFSSDLSSSASIAPTGDWLRCAEPWVLECEWQAPSPPAWAPVVIVTPSVGVHHAIVVITVAGDTCCQCHSPNTRTTVAGDTCCQCHSRDVSDYRALKLCR